ncbi:MAG TPA: isopentenyl-diphosphate delta-isomerase [Nocardioides bacterium]|uniref:isopentenyl-diphosphate Delta-isomerase n=1 Tax=uncultured Nocardioides sp. TaxID=198441 RepID=UPI000ECD2EA2|nr:isopentenyl-diphosphate Delta-isomerase [uncultured Nocardioides sp.]HCB03964.1 isopentenyl-diphosphate delta-isomerase [Nocardioides sp.]HRD60741.1 isopentenyl-diphosphate Delta-isomerase [Nocardioides sp.]
MTSLDAEQVVLLDSDGHAIGAAAKTDVHGLDTPLHLAFSCYVFDGAGRLLITQRALAKPTFGGVWTNSCCGHPAPGEPIADAVRRRTGQELGLRLEKVKLVLPAFGYRAIVPSGPYAGWVEHELCPVFTAIATEDPQPDPTEVETWEWVAWPEFRADVLAGRREVSQWCREQVQLLPADPLAAPAADPGELPPAARG